MKTEKQYFAGCGDEMEVKARYRDLAKQHHPDLVGGDGEEMKAVNSQYSECMAGHYQGRENSTAESCEFWQEREDEMTAILVDLLKVAGVEVEIIGVWLWITGDTRPVKEELKALACRWSSSKKCWYWRSASHKWKGRSSGKSLDGLRDTWGSGGSRSSGAGSPKRKALS